MGLEGSSVSSLVSAPAPALSRGSASSGPKVSWNMGILTKIKRKFSHLESRRLSWRGIACFFVGSSEA